MSATDKYTHHYLGAQYEDTKRSRCAYGQPLAFRMTRRQLNPRPIRQCSECRRRKKKCDGIGAGDEAACGPCRERGVGDRCRGGIVTLTPSLSRMDEAVEPPITTHPPESVVSREISEEQMREAAIALSSLPMSQALINELTQADTLSPPARTLEERRRSASSRSLPSRSQALNLVQIYEDQLCFGALHIIDFETVRSGIHTLPIIARKDVLALVLLLAASTLDLLPSSYAIALGLVTKSEDAETLVRYWTDEGLSALLACDLYLEPTIVAVQALVVYQYNLVEQ